MAVTSGPRSGAPLTASPAGAFCDHPQDREDIMPTKPKHYTKPKTDKAEFVIDRTMARILKRDGRRSYRDASSDLLTMYAATIAHMDGGSTRLIQMLRRLAATHVRLDAYMRKKKAKRPVRSRTAVAAWRYGSRLWILRRDMTMMNGPD
jgi:hypothetical protein